MNATRTCAPVASVPCVVALCSSCVPPRIHWSAGTYAMRGSVSSKMPEPSSIALLRCGKVRERGRWLEMGMDVRCKDGDGEDGDRGDRAHLPPFRVSTPTLRPWA